MIGWEISCLHLYFNKMNGMALTADTEHVFLFCVGLSQGTCQTVRGVQLFWRIGL